MIIDNLVVTSLLSEAIGLAASSDEDIHRRLEVWAEQASVEKLQTVNQVLGRLFATAEAARRKKLKAGAQ